jgi:hypothetical protein
MADGRVIKGRFGAVDAVDATGTTPDTSAVPSSASGNPVTPGDVQKQLQLIAHNAQVAATRIIQIPPTGSVPANVLEDLLRTFVTLQGNIADIASRIGTEDAAAATKDATAIQAQVQAFIDGVEAAIKTAGGPAAIVPAGTPKQIPWMLIGGGALGLLAIGIGVYQYRKSTLRATRAAARGARSSAFAGVAASSSRKRKKGRKGRKHFEE